MSAASASERPLSMSYLTAPMATPVESVVVAGEAGYQHVGLRLGPVVPGGSSSPMVGNATMQASCLSRLAEYGMSVIEIEGFTIDLDFDGMARLPVIETAARLGKPVLLAVADLRGQITLDDVVERIGHLSEIAHGYGLKVAFEPIAHRTGGSLDEARHVAAASGAGLALDMLHLDRMGIAPEQLATLDTRIIHAIHLCDAPTKPDDLVTMIKHSAEDRELPGDGVLPIQRYLAALPSSLPLSVEIPLSRVAAALTPQVRARRCLDATRKFLRSIAH